jgi:ketosteroid isomerase-like protein
MDTSLPMKVADIDLAFEKAFNARDLDTLLKLYDDQSVLVEEPGKPVRGLENIKKALMGFLALKLPIQLTVRRVYENGDVGLCCRQLEHSWKWTRWQGCQTRRDISGGGQENLGRQLGMCDR